MTDTQADTSISWDDPSPGDGRPSATAPDPAVELRQMASSQVNRYAVAVVIVAGVLLTFLVAFVTVASERSDRSDRFNAEAIDASEAIGNRYNEYVAMLTGFRGLYAATDGASREEFDAYITAASLLDRYPGALALGWAPMVPESEVDAVVESVRDDGFPDFEIKPETTTQPDRYPVVYLEPIEGNENAFGFDVGADDKGRATVERAASTGEPTNGAVLVVLQDDEEESRAFNLYVPIYDGGGVPEEEAQRESRFLGLTLGLLDGAGTFGDLFGDDAPIKVEIFDLGPTGGSPGVRPTERNLLYDSDDQLHGVEGTGSLSQRVESVVGGRRWVMYFEPGPGFSAPRGEFPWLIIAAGLMITGLIAALIVSFAQSRKQAALLADQMTAYLRQRETELQRANDDIVRSNKELERYASIAAHDLQEPLRSLLAYASVLERRYGETLDPEVRDQVSRMARAAERMRSLVVDLLAYARADSGESKIVAVDLNDAVRIAIDDLSVLIHESGATIRVSDLPIVPGNRRELIGLFSNLLSNALKYRSDQPPEVLIVAHRQGDFWVIGVKDNGIGVDPAYHERIFELFRRLEKRSSDSGTGLGLAICARTVSQHGGRIWVESSEGQGATFWFTLLAEAPATGAAP